MSSPTTRVALWDHARFALIVLVVVGHMLTTVRLDNELAYALYVWIFLFHMPAMLFLSGLFTRAEMTTKALRSTWQLLLVWILWELIWAVIRYVFFDRVPGANWLVTPAWTLWFLLSLATMRILLPLIARLRFPLATSVIVALLAGFSPAIGAPFSASRTLCFLPFFVAGWIAKEHGWFERAWFMEGARRMRAIGIILLAGSFTVLALIPNLADLWRIDRWLTWRDGYEALLDGTDVPLAAGVAIRAGLLAAAALLTFAIICVVPRGHGRTTVWGSRTLYVYLLHGPIIIALRETGVIERIEQLGPVGVPLLVLTGVGIAAVLSMTWVTRLFKPVIEPGFGWLIRREGRGA